jgi:hypothetical protein
MWSGLIALALLALSEPLDVPPPLRAAVSEALALPGARAEILELAGSLPARCTLTRAELPGPITSSGRVAVHLFGAGVPGRSCVGWAWARVRVTAPSLVTTRAVVEGDPLAAAVAVSEREVQPGKAPLSALPEGAIAARALSAGVPLDETLLRVGARPGETVAVVLQAGALSVEQQGRAIACRRGRVCALLPSGRRVEGIWHEGRIVLGSP